MVSNLLGSPLHRDERELSAVDSQLEVSNLLGSPLHRDMKIDLKRVETLTLCVSNLLGSPLHRDIVI